MSEITSELIDDILRRALAEDLGCNLGVSLGTDGDITSAAVFSRDDRAQAVIKSKESGRLSGTYLLAPLFEMIDKGISVELQARDGAVLAPQTPIARLSGPLRGILAGERIALNFLQRLSGIATQTAKLTAAISHSKARLLDTRKTTPTLRAFEKKAVVDGGGYNHRFGLFDMMLIKDTHIKAAGGIGMAITLAKNAAAENKFKIEVEVQSVEECMEAAALAPDRIMLDNMSINDMKKCVKHVRANEVNVELEASGNVTLATIKAIAETGVDFISCGSITHSAPALDIHLVIV